MKKLIIILFACALYAIPAKADTIENPFAYFQVYSASNIGTESEAYGSDFQGTAGAGGDVNFGAFTANTHLKNNYGLHVGGNAKLTGGSYYKNVEVGGNLSIQSLDINGDVFVGGSVTGISGGTINGDLNASGNVNLPGSTTVTGAINLNHTYMPYADFNAITDHFSSVSSFYGNRSNTTSYLNNYGGLEVSLASGVNIITMTADEFNNAWGLAVRGATDGKLIINLTGESAKLDSTVLEGIDSSKILLNYVDATSLSISGGNTLNILAINADTDFSYGHIDGNLIVGNLTGGGQVNLGYFGTNIEYHTPGGEDPNTAVPEPTTVAMLALGCLLVCRKRQS